MPSAPLASPKITTCACGGRIEATTNGNGSLVDRCARCGAKPGEGRAIALRPQLGVACKVSGCPGILDAGGRCSCCEKREAWAAAHTPKRTCEICTGTISGRRNMKYCLACKPIAQRALMANYVTKAKKK